MLQLVELTSSTSTTATSHAPSPPKENIGKGQQIELEMAHEVGIKVFQVIQPRKWIKRRSNNSISNGSEGGVGGGGEEVNVTVVDFEIYSYESAKHVNDIVKKHILRWYDDLCPTTDPTTLVERIELWT